jgi:2-polyprenyl-6-hydroxyphenyl methylase/3-demethylubiquinone-9 3-methyltransferase
VTSDGRSNSGPSEAWDTGTHEAFLKYYEEKSLSPKTRERFEYVRDRLLRMIDPKRAAQGLDVADIGCGAGSQSLLWAQLGHRVHGLDINSELVKVGRKRAAAAGVEIDFAVGSATALPWADASQDVVLSPELLEHVRDWKTVVDESCRILRPGGLLYLSTTNRLCPKQYEYQLPLYSWYPAPLKRHYEKLAVTSRPELVQHAKYPAVHWFTFYELRDYLEPRGFRCLDRFDLMEVEGRNAPVRMALAALRGVSVLRYLGHVATPWSVVVAERRRA